MSWFKRIQQYVLDFVVCLLFGIILFIPFINVSLLRIILDDSISIKERLHNKKRPKWMR